MSLQSIHVALWRVLHRILPKEVTRTHKLAESQAAATVRAIADEVEADSRSPLATSLQTSSFRLNVPLNCSWSFLRWWVMTELCRASVRVLNRPIPASECKPIPYRALCAGMMTGDACHLHNQSAAGNGYLSHLPAASTSASLFGGLAPSISALWNRFTLSPFTAFGSAELPPPRFFYLRQPLRFSRSCVHHLSGGAATTRQVRNTT